MKQPIAGVAPPEAGEVVSMTVWPSIGAYGLGRLVGRLSASRIGWGFFTLGKVLALATIPLSLVLFAWRLLPFVGRRYVLTNRRVVIRKGLSGEDGDSVELDKFDSIQVRVLPGQEFLFAGEVIFQRDGSEVLRLSGVTRPEVFRRICLKGRDAVVSVAKVLEMQAAAEPA